MGLRLPPHLFAAAPYEVYLRCRNARGRPKDLRGEWMTQGQVYAGQYATHRVTGKTCVRLFGRHAEPPHEVIPAWRFDEVAEVWLN